MLKLRFIWISINEYKDIFTLQSNIKDSISRQIHKSKNLILIKQRNNKNIEYIMFNTFVKPISSKQYDKKDLEFIKVEIT